MKRMDHLEVAARAQRVAESRREFVAASETVACGNAGWHRDECWAPGGGRERGGWVGEEVGESVWG